MRLVRDSKGNPSWTCTLAIPGSIVLTLRILLGGFSITFHDWSLVVSNPDSTVVLALMAFLGFFAQRDISQRIIESKFPPDPSSS